MIKMYQGGWKKLKHYWESSFVVDNGCATSQESKKQHGELEVLSSNSLDVEKTNNNISNDKNEILYTVHTDVSRNHSSIQIMNEDNSQWHDTQNSTLQIVPDPKVKFSVTEKSNCPEHVDSEVNRGIFQGNFLKGTFIARHPGFYANGENSLLLAPYKTLNESVGEMDHVHFGSEVRSDTVHYSRLGHLDSKIATAHSSECNVAHRFSYSMSQPNSASDILYNPVLLYNKGNLRREDRIVIPHKQNIEIFTEKKSDNLKNEDGLVHTSSMDGGFGVHSVHTSSMDGGFGVHSVHTSSMDGGFGVHSQDFGSSYSVENCQGNDVMYERNMADYTVMKKKKILSAVHRYTFEDSGKTKRKKDRTEYRNHSCRHLSHHGNLGTIPSSHTVYIENEDKSRKVTTRSEGCHDNYIKDRKYAKRKSGMRSQLAVIAKAIMRSPERKMTLKEIYKYIQENNTEYLRRKDWRNGVRHTLSFNKCFVKVGKTEEKPFRCNYWSIHPACFKSFSEGNFNSLQTRQLVLKYSF